MLTTHLTQLLAKTPPGVDETLELVAGFDACLSDGLARIGEKPAAKLAALSEVLRETSLGDRVGEAVAKASRGSLTDDHLAALAAGRTALLGAVHDTLCDHWDAAMGRTRAVWDRPLSSKPLRDHQFSGVLAWLRELAIAGWRGIDHDQVSASDQVIAALVAEAASGDGQARRLAILVDGLAEELRACCPIVAVDRFPERRWADLWARAILLAQPGAPVTSQYPVDRVSGRLLILGVDVHEHGTAAHMEVHGLLELPGDRRPSQVRTCVTASKVDTISGCSLWRLFDNYPIMLRALAERRILEVREVALLPSGDLVWQEDHATVGEVADPFATARVLLSEALLPAVPPLERHPVGLAEPVLVEGYTASIDPTTAALTFGFDGVTLEVDCERLPACGPLTAELVTASSACLGLVRWDAGRWSLQPLAIQATVKRKIVTAGTGDWARGPLDPKVIKAETKTGDPVAVLRERAGRLLRR